MNFAWEIEDFLEAKNNQLFINGVSAIELASKFETPLFVFSAARIKHNIEKLRRAEKLANLRLKICYAAKANSNMGVLRTVKESGADLEVNSGGELFKALKVGFAPSQIIFNGTSKTHEEIAQAIDAEIYAIQVDSIYELELIREIAAQKDKRGNVSLRLVPEIETDTMHGLQTALLTSKFGMMPEEAFEAFRKYRNDRNLNLCGIHLHLGSQNPSSEPYARALKTLFEGLHKIFADTGIRLSHLNLGGGFPVNYLRDKSQYEDFPTERTDLFEVEIDPAETIASAWQVLEKEAREANSQDLLENLTLLIEPGRSVIADACVVLTAVRNKKVRPVSDATPQSLSDGASQEKTFSSNPQSKTRNPKSEDIWLLTDAGFNLLLSMETYKWYYQLISASRAGEPHTTPYKVAGPLCDGGDVYFDIEGEHRLPEYRLLPENVEPGEILALLNSGAYSLAQMFPYNGRALPAAVLIKENGEIELIRRRDTFEDLIANDLW